MHQGCNSLMPRRDAGEALESGFVGKLDTSAASADEIDLGCEATLVAGFHVEHADRGGRGGDQLANGLDAVNYLALVRSAAADWRAARLARQRRRGRWICRCGGNSRRRSRGLRGFWRAAIEAWAAAFVEKIFHQVAYTIRTRGQLYLIACAVGGRACPAPANWRGRHFAIFGMGPCSTFQSSILASRL